MNGIPSDNILAYILTFLPSTEYKKIPFLSKHFQYISRNNPQIYNEKGYQIKLQFNVNPKYFEPNSETQIQIYHRHDRYYGGGKA